MPAIPAAIARAARTTRGWVLWLALALAAAHSFATWHAYTHPAGTPDSVSRKAAHTNADTCVLCLAAAGLDGAPAAAPTWHLEPTPPATVVAAAQPRGPQADAARPYAIRAPPLAS